ncbi:hypothetical protein [Listeria fleischmannii]|nr:hypothetical protein [Listeria fleischmannii]
MNKLQNERIKLARKTIEALMKDDPKAAQLYWRSFKKTRKVVRPI